VIDNIAAMSDILFRNRFRIPSARLPNWDYGRGGVYCVTICTSYRICWFGEIAEGRMDLSEAGGIVGEEWEEMARRRPYVQLDSWVVMPNHFHGILHIEPPRLSGRERPLGNLIGHFKGACSQRIRALGHARFAWQARFFDQIVRDEDTLKRFRGYIRDNPARWEKDKHHPNARGKI
jgi:putative transposase